MSSKNCMQTRMVKPFIDFHLNSKQYDFLKRHLSQCENCQEVAQTFERKIHLLSSIIPIRKMDERGSAELMNEVSEFIENIEKEKSEVIMSEKKNFLKSCGFDLLKALCSPAVFACGGIAVLFIYIFKG